MKAAAQRNENVSETRGRASYSGVVVGGSKVGGHALHVKETKVELRGG